MIFWIKKISRIVAYSAFFLLFFCGIDLNDPFNTQRALIAFLKALGGSALLWVTTFVIFDIVLKGAVEDIPKENIEVLDGGIIQRIHEEKSERKVLDIAEKKPPEKKEEGKKEKKKKQKMK